MGLLDNLLNNPQAQQGVQNYVQRYQQGAPHEGYSDQEVVQRYRQVAPQLPAQDFQKAAEQAFDNMPPDQRAQFLLSNPAAKAALAGIAAMAISNAMGARAGVR